VTFKAHRHDRGSGKSKPAPIPLSMAEPGEDVVLADVISGRRLEHRLAELGLTPGARFRVISKGRPGPFIVSVKDSRLILGFGMVHAILVHPT